MSSDRLSPFSSTPDEVAVPIDGSFKLEFEKTPEDTVLVRIDSYIGTAGPVELTDDEADRLADLITFMFELLRTAQDRQATY